MWPNYLRCLNIRYFILFLGLWLNCFQFKIEDLIGLCEQTEIDEWGMYGFHSWDTPFETSFFLSFLFRLLSHIFCFCIFILASEIAYIFVFGLFRFGTFVGYWFFSSEMISFYNPILSYSSSGICHWENMISSILLEGHVWFIVFFCICVSAVVL